MAALEGLSCAVAPALTGRLSHGGWAREMCRDELWILLYVRTVTVTASLVSDYGSQGGLGSPRPPDTAATQGGLSAARQFGQASATRGCQIGLIWFGLINETCAPLVPRLSFPSALTFWVRVSSP